MAAPKNNAYYLLRKNSGRDHVYESVEDFTEACITYFEWCDKNPFKEEQVFCFKGMITRTHVKKMRPYDLWALCNHIGICESTFRNYENRKGFLDITARVRQIIDAQQYAGAASGFLKENIVARRLGMADKQEVKSDNTTVIKEAPQVTVMTNENIPSFASSEDQIDVQVQDRTDL